MSSATSRYKGIGAIYPYPLFVFFKFIPFHLLSPKSLIIFKCIPYHLFFFQIYPLSLIFFFKYIPYLLLFSSNLSLIPYFAKRIPYFAKFIPYPPYFPIYPLYIFCIPYFSICIPYLVSLIFFHFYPLSLIFSQLSIIPYDHHPPHQGIKYKWPKNKV